MSNSSTGQFALWKRDFIEGEKLEKLDMFIVGTLQNLRGFCLCVKNNWVDMNCDLQKPSQKLKLLRSIVRVWDVRTLQIISSEEIVITSLVSLLGVQNCLSSAV